VKKKIIEDYALSQEGLSRERTQMVQEMAKDGLDASFADAPPDVMLSTLRYIGQRWGSIEKYLDYIGLVAEMRVKIKRNLMLHLNPGTGQTATMTGVSSV